MRKVYAFDFDGTLTTCDTLLAFIPSAGPDETETLSELEGQAEGLLLFL